MFEAEVAGSREELERRRWLALARAKGMGAALVLSSSEARRRANGRPSLAVPGTWRGGSSTQEIVVAGVVEGAGRGDRGRGKGRDRAQGSPSGALRGE